MYSPVVGMGPQVGLSLSHMGETARPNARTSLEPGVVACVGVESSRVCIISSANNLHKNAVIVISDSHQLRDVTQVLNFHFKFNSEIGGNLVGPRYVCIVWENVGGIQIKQLNLQVIR